MANLYPPPLEKQETDKQSLAERVAAILRDMFLSGELRPGQRLIETEIAEQLEVSRGPVRDALKILQEEGIVHIEPRKASFIVELDYEDLVDFYLLRGAIEGLGARLLAEKGTPEQIAQLETCLVSLRSAVHDLKKFAQLDLRFHELLCELPGHKWLYKQWLSMKTYIWLFIQASQEVLDVPGNEGMADLHAEIFQAIRCGLPSLAEQAAQRHSVIAGEQIRLIWAQSPQGLRIPSVDGHRPKMEL